MQEHPARGFKELCRREDLAWGQLMMVYSHHERCDGRGYPVGMVQTEIHEYARLCAIADVSKRCAAIDPIGGHRGGAMSWSISTARPGGALTRRCCDAGCR